MKLSISNIAWENSLDPAVAEVLREQGVRYIDIAPGRYFSDPACATDAEIAAVASWWADQGIRFAGMQSLLFGTQGLNLFGSEEQQERMLEHLRAICHIGAVLDARKLVFGSPKNRDRTGLSDAEAAEVAIGFFSRLGDIAAKEGVTICLEPNPVIYGANFLTTTQEAFEFVSQLGYPAVKIQLDTGTILQNEEPADIIRQVAGQIGHIHISEPHLPPVGTNTKRHAELCATIGAIGYSAPVTLEMLVRSPLPVVETISESIRFAKSIYGEYYGRI